MERKKPVTVTIFSTEYPIQADVDPDRVREVAKFVDGKMKEISTATSIRSTTRVAILAALNIADETVQGARCKPCDRFEARPKYIPIVGHARPRKRSRNKFQDIGNRTFAIIPLNTY